MEVNSVKATPTGRSTKGLVLMISAAALVASLALAPAASAAGTPLAGESTSVTLKKGVVKFLTNAGVSVAPISPARAKGRTISFPVTGGNLDLGTGKVLARHSGGLRVSAGGVKIPLRSFVFGGKVGKRIILTGKAGGARLPLFSLDTKTAKVNRAGFGAKVTGIQVALTGKAAAALNQAFGVNLLSGGLVVGSSRTVLQPRVVDLKATGATKLVPSAGALSALTAAGVTPSAVGPATLGPGGFSFPVIGGRLGLDPLGGRILHSGGIGLAERLDLGRVDGFHDPPRFFARPDGEDSGRPGIDCDSRPLHREPQGEAEQAPRQRNRDQGEADGDGRDPPQRRLRHAVRGRGPAGDSVDLGDRQVDGDRQPEVERAALEGRPGLRKRPAGSDQRAWSR